MSVKLKVKIEGTISVNPNDYGMHKTDFDEDALFSAVQEEFESGALELVDLDYEPFTISVQEPEDTED